MGRVFDDDAHADADMPCDAIEACIDCRSKPKEPGLVTDPTSPQIRRLVGVYHASGTLWGELSYWLKARVGRAHCALCDITHGSVREKTAWQQCRSELPVPFVAVHLDERSPALATFTEGRTPCVVAETSAGFAMLVEADRLDTCDGSPTCLVEVIETRADELGLVLGRV